MLHGAGFVDIETSASFEVISSKDDVRFMHTLAYGIHFAPETIESDIERGIATRDEIDELKRAVDEWKDSPGAINAIAWGEAVGRKP